MISKEAYKRRLHVLRCIIMAAEECVNNDEILTKDLLTSRACDYGVRSEVTAVEVQVALRTEFSTLLIESIKHD